MIRFKKYLFTMLDRTSVFRRNDIEIRAGSGLNLNRKLQAHYYLLRPSQAGKNINAAIGVLVLILG